MGLAILLVGLLAARGVCYSGAQSDQVVQAHLRRAGEASAKGAWSEAAKEYNEVLELEPNNAEVYGRLGLTYHNAGIVPEAIKSLEHALRLDPGLPGVEALLGLDYVVVGKYADAIPCLERAFAKEEAPAVRSLVGERLAQCYLKLGKTDQSLQTVQKLRELYPDDPDVLYTAAKVYGNMWNEAVQRMLEKAPESWQVHQVLAEVLDAQGKYSLAAGEYRQVLRINPHLPGAHYRLGRAISRADPSNKGTQEAFSEFQEELEIDASDIPTHVAIGEIHLKSGKLVEARNSFARALRLQPSYIPAQIGLAKVFIAEKDYQHAAGQLEEALRRAPEDETIYYNLTIAYRNLGEGEKAKRAFGKFQELKDRKEQRLSAIWKQFRTVIVQSSADEQ